MIRAKPATPISGAFELTPLIDIVFIVVVFLLLTANSQLLSMTVDIPRSESATTLATQPEHVVRINLHAHVPLWSLNDQRYADWAAFKPALIATIKSGSPERQFNIASDQQATVQPLIELLSLLTAEGITNTHILMEAQP